MKWVKALIKSVNDLLCHSWNYTKLVLVYQWLYSSLTSSKMILSHRQLLKEALDTIMHIFMKYINFTTYNNPKTCNTYLNTHTILITKILYTPYQAPFSIFLWKKSPSAVSPSFLSNDNMGKPISFLYTYTKKKTLRPCL